jgi:hypothetical protein
VPSTTLSISGSFNTPALTTTSTYTISCTGAGGSASKSATVTVNTGGACSTSGATAAITLSNVPSRISGVAPLSVFFDATGTTASATSIPFQELEYTWGFNDPAGGATWAYGSRTGASKNVAKGPVAAHVFETVGTYSVSLSITDGTNTVSNACTQITVQDPAAVFAAANTICVAASTLPVAGVDGCPTGAAVHTQPAFDTAISSYAATGKRILFKHDDVFTGTSNAVINPTGPGMIGMYGVGAKPIIHTAGAYATISISNSSNTSFSDWRIMDLEIDGLASPTAGGINAGGISDNITLLRLDIHNVVFGWNIAGDGLEYNATHPPYTTPHEFDGWTIADCNTYDTDSSGASGVMGMYAFGHRFAILGSRIYHVISGEHAVRIEHASKAVFSNNTFGDPAPTKQAFSLRAPTYTDVGAQEYLPNTLPGLMAYTTQVVVSDNHFIAGRSGQPVDNKPSAVEYNAHFDNIIFERNWYQVGTSTVCCSPMLGIRSQNITVRNELFDLTGAATHSVMTIDGATAVGPASSDVKVYNNTAFSNDAHDIYFMRQYVSSGIIIQNNFMYAPNAISESNGAPAFYDPAGGTPALASNNTSNALITSSTANLTTVPPTTPAGFMPASGSYAIGAGASVPVWSDFNLIPLTSSSTRDMGAVHQ